MASRIGLFRFGEESWNELKKVTWPERDRVVRLSILVIIISSIIAVYILGFDLVFTHIITIPLERGF